MSKALEYYQKNAPNKIIIKNNGDLTDTIILSALVRDIHECYPGLFITDVMSKYDFMLEDAPYIKHLDMDSDDVNIVGVTHNDKSPLHRIQTLYQDFNDKTGLEVKPTKLTGEVYISDGIENSDPPHDSDYWIMSTTEHTEYSALGWDKKYFQEIKEYFKGRIEFVEVNMENIDSWRDLIPLVYHSSGIICANDALSHLSAAIRFKGDPKRLRPCVVVGGGIQSPSKVSYDGQQYLNTIGMLQCCKYGGCYKTKILENGDEEENPNDSCDYIVKRSDGEYLSKCMSMINHFDVIRIVERYLSYSDV